MHKKIAILSCVNIKHMSLISLYTEELKRLGASYDIIYMDKYDEDEPFDCEHKYRYVNCVNQKWPRLVKKIMYMRFVPYAKRILKRNKYDFVIVWNDVAIFSFANFLSRRFKGRYCLNVRDNMYYDKPQYARMYERCFTRSAFNTISSKGFLDFLPRKASYVPIHSFNTAALLGMKQHERMRNPDEPIRIGFIGYVRFYETNKRMLSVFANDPRYELHYYGKNSNILKEYAEENKIENAVFHDSFPVSDTAKYLQNLDVINNLYGNGTLNIRKAISIKFYHALYSKIPILVNTDTYIGDLAVSLGFGYYVTEVDAAFKDDFYNWYHSLDFSALSAMCEEQLAIATSDNDKLRKLIDTIIVGQNV